MSVITKDLGAVTAYAAAVNRGYTGSREEFEILMASYAYVGEHAAESASNASQSATNASQSATDAETAKGTAQAAASSAQTFKSVAEGFAQSAQQSAQSASQSAQNAESAKNTAVSTVDEFDSHAQQALDSVNQAGNNWKSLAQIKALDSEAWAVGQRDGEDVGTSDPAYHNNSKWYAQQGGTSAQTASEAAQTATQKASEAQASASAAAESARTLTIDKTLTQSGQAADAKATGDEIDSVKSDLSELEAVTTEDHGVQTSEPVTTSFTDGYITNTGVVTQSTSYHYTEKFAVKEGDIFSTAGTNIRFVTAYNGNSVVSDKGVSSTTNTYTVPSGVSHIVLSLFAAATTITKTYYKKVLVNALDGLLDIKDVLVFTSLNRFDVSTIFENTTLNSSGNGTSADSTRNTSDYIYVGDLDSVKIYKNSTPVLYNVYYVLYDADKNPIGSRAIGNNIILSEQAIYIRISYAKSESNIQVCDGSKTISWYSEYETPTTDRDSIRIKTLESEDGTLWNSNVLYGKKWVSCGDSFTAGAFQDVSEPSEKYIMSGKYLGKNKVYPYIIGNRNNMDIVNEAVSGSTMCLNDGTHNAFSTANGRYTQIPEDADYITLYFGINDVNYNSPMGEITDNTNTTFYGAWNVVLDYLITNHPFAKIGIIVTNGASQAIREAEIAIAKRWGIAFYDMNGLPLMHRSFNQDVLTSVKNFRNDKFRVSASNAHPNGKAHEYQSTAIEAWLRSL